MQTEPTLIARSSASASGPRPRNSARYRPSAATPLRPAAVAANVRYVGALSRKLERPPLAQKSCHGCRKPNSPPRAFRMRSAGPIVTKMPAKSTATSTIGAKLNRFWTWYSSGVEK